MIHNKEIETNYEPYACDLFQDELEKIYNICPQMLHILKVILAVTEQPRDGSFTIMTTNICLHKLYCLHPHLKFSVLALIPAVTLFFSYLQKEERLLWYIKLTVRREGNLLGRSSYLSANYLQCIYSALSSSWLCALWELSSSQPCSHFMFT